jgi:hypothetical protein
MPLSPAHLMIELTPAQLPASTFAACHRGAAGPPFDAIAAPCRPTIRCRYRAWYATLRAAAKAAAALRHATL